MKVTSTTAAGKSDRERRTLRERASVGAFR
jgi:hypothetical protein